VRYSTALWAGRGAGLRVECRTAQRLRINGSVYLYHFALRLVLWQKNLAPLHYVRFLDYATARIFLRKIGGAYVSVHCRILGIAQRGIQQLLSSTMATRMNSQLRAPDTVASFGFACPPSLTRHRLPYKDEKAFTAEEHINTRHPSTVYKGSLSEVRLWPWDSSTPPGRG
jgi:hypothetical protein